MKGLFTLVTMCLLAVSTQAKYSGGSGTAQDPYQIATAADLIALGETPEDYDKHFLLTADIDLDPNLPGRKVFDKAVIAPDANDANWSFDGAPFTGVFDGNGHILSHLTIKGGGLLGLFGELGAWDAPAGDVRDLGLVDVSVASTGALVGGLVGLNYGTTTGCYSTGMVTGKGWGTGGLAGGNDGTIATSYSTASVRGAAYVGGLAGGNEGTLTRCHSSGTVSGSSEYVGGLVGWSKGGYVGQCYSTGAVSGESFVGGLVGEYYGDLIQCYSTSSVSGNDCVGGLVGKNWGTVTNSYSTGMVRGTEWSVGGLVGTNGDWNTGGSVINCYSTGRVSGMSEVGGLVGSTVRGTVTNCFWDIQTSDQATSKGGTGKATAQMQTAKTFLDAGWDFMGEAANGTGDIWKIAEGLGYPRLSWEKYGGGSGTAKDPYQIATAPDLIALGEDPNDYDKHFILTADIDLDPNLPGRKVFDKAVIVSDGPYVPLFWGVFPATLFTGVFDGNGHTIAHLTIKGENHLGVFAYLGSGAKVSDLGVIDANVSASGGSVGGLVGYNLFGDITRCYSTGAIAGTEEVGGLVGFNVGSVTQSYSTAEVSGTVRVGGLAGINGIGGLGGRPGISNQCYSTGAVSGGSFVGGLVGDNRAGTVSQCYSTGTVRFRRTGEYSGSSVGGLVGSNRKEGASTRVCFWDIQTSGQGSSAGGTGRTTGQMQMAKTFLDVGWDFVGETKNGTEDIWWILEGKDYPRLWWELIPEK